MATYKHQQQLGICLDRTDKVRYKIQSLHNKTRGNFYCSKNRNAERQIINYTVSENIMLEVSNPKSVFPTPSEQAIVFSLTLDAAGGHVTTLSEVTDTNSAANSHASKLVSALLLSHCVTAAAQSAHWLCTTARY